MTDIRAGLLGKLPTGDGNGLQAIAAEAIKDPKRIRVGIILYDCLDADENFDKGTTTARLRIRRVEDIRTPEHASALQRILMREFETRTGHTTLPMELEEAVEAAFAGLDPDQIAADEVALPKPASEPAGPGVNPVVCACGKEIHFDQATDGWLDTDGWPADDGHAHQPPDAPETDTL